MLLAAACDGRTPAGPVTPGSVAALPTFTLTGIVRERLPGGGVGAAVRAARLEVLGKPGVVATASTDADGAFRVTGVGGTFQVRGTKPGYDPALATVTAMTSERSLDLTISPRPSTLAGAVFETAPTQQKAIGGARLQVVSGANAGASAVSDAAGRYTLPSMWGEFDIQVVRDGYATGTAHVVMAGDQALADIHLAPAPRTITETFGDGRSFLQPFHATVLVHNPGEIVITDWAAYGFEEGDGTRVQIWEDGQLLVQTYVERSFPRRTVLMRAPVSAGRTYEIRCLGWPLTTMTFTHPT